MSTNSTTRAGDSIRQREDYYARGKGNGKLKPSNRCIPVNFIVIRKGVGIRGDPLVADREGASSVAAGLHRPSPTVYRFLW